MEPGDARNVLTQLRRGTIEYCVLAVLADGRSTPSSSSGGSRAVDGLVTSEGTIYPLLSRLRRDGLVTTTWQESDCRAATQVLPPDAAGRRALAGFTEEWTRFRDAVDELLVGGRGPPKGDKVTIVDSDAAGQQLVSDYLGRLAAAGAACRPRAARSSRGGARAHRRGPAGRACGGHRGRGRRTQRPRQARRARGDRSRGDRARAGPRTQPPCRRNRPPQAASLRDVSTVLLLMFGGLLFGIGWVVGVALLWTSPRWRTRDKWLATFGLALRLRQRARCSARPMASRRPPRPSARRAGRCAPGPGARRPAPRAASACPAGSAS